MRMVIDKICKMTVKGVKSKSESFFSISHGVLELWKKNLRGRNPHPPPGLDRVKPKGQRDHPALHHANKVAKTNADKTQLFVESVERHFGIESDHFDSNHFDEVNKFIEDNHRYFIPLRTQMTTVLTLEMNMSLWPILTPKPSLS